MFALPCSYVPRHAAPREPLAPQTRTVLALGLAAAVIPLSAAPALAEGSAPTGTTSTTSSAAEAAPAAESGPAKAPEAQPRAKSETDLVFRAPAKARRSRVEVGIRLTSAGKGVRNGYVRLEKSTDQGWTYVGRLLTNGDGVGSGTLPVSGSTRLRAAYTGSEVRTPAVSSARVVRAGSTRSTASETPSDDEAPSGSEGVLREAARHLGAPYRYGADGPDAFDCSGYTRYVYGRLGKSLPHSSSAQRQAATPVSRSDARPGDLVFIPGHVGIYAGGGRMYDAPGSGRSVVLRDIYTSNYTVGRVL